MRKLYLYSIEVMNVVSNYRQYITFACVSDDPGTALKTILDSVPFHDYLKSGAQDEHKRLSQFSGPNGHVFVEIT